MLEIFLPIADIILNILLVVLAAKWAAQRTDRARAIAFGCAVGLLYGVASDIALSYVVSGYERTLSSLTINALLGVPIDIAIGYFVTRRTYALVAPSVA